MNHLVTPFDTHFLDQLNLLPPDEWQTNAYDLLMHNEWQPWFHAYQVLNGQKLVGFGMLFHFRNVAWLGWILTHKNYRKQGIGTSITEHLIAEGTKLGATTFLLTATELGQPIYEKLGFKTTSYYRFFRAPEKLKTTGNPIKTRKALPSDLEAIFQLDQMATGEDRRVLMAAHIEEATVYVNNTVEGFYLPNLGNGMLAASTAEAGQQLFAYRIKKNKGLVAVPEQNSEFIDYLLKNGFTEGFKIPRMTLGNETDWKPEMIFCRAAGYCG